ncbi:MAG: Multidrug resistance operon repressor [Burkholderia plantarii]|nr:MAG: Multidrug resistance operon repressor [Burkholderia plantarii]
MVADFLTFRLDLTSALMIERANAVYRAQWDLDVRTLRVLRLICTEAGITPKAVSQRALIEKTLLSKMLSQLESRGLIGRQAHPDDRRSLALHPTPDGMAVARDSARAGAELEAELLTVLSDEERGALERTLTKLTRHLLPADTPAAPC